MNNSGNAPARVEPLYCPVCPGDRPKTRKKASDIVCGDCYRQWTNESAIALAQGSFINIFNWVAKKAPTILASLEEQYVSAKTEIEKLQDEVGKEAFAALKKNTGGENVPLEVWKPAYQQKKQELWRAKGGNAKFAKMKELESRITLLKQIIEKALNPEPQMVEEPHVSELEPEIIPGAENETSSVKQPRQKKKREQGKTVEEPDNLKTQKATRGGRQTTRRAVAKEAAEAIAAQS